MDFNLHQLRVCYRKYKRIWILSIANSIVKKLSQLLLEIKLKNKKNDLKGLLRNKNSDFTKNFNKILDTLEDDSEFKEDS